MDLIANLMDARKTMKTIRVPTGQVHGVMNSELDEYPNECEEFALAQTSNNSTLYAKQYQKEEEDMYNSVSKIESRTGGGMSMVDSHMDLVSSVSVTEINQLKEEQSCEVYRKYRFDKHRSQDLLIDRHREHIIQFVNTNSVVIIQGPTGCGKTTQVPQFILDDAKANDRPCKIVVTQPRRIAAISVARRVCEEREWALGSVCGYQVGLEKNLASDTLLAYVTTGVLLQKLINQKNLLEYTHIIVDEVHERNQDMDFLLLIIRRFLNTNSFMTKVILMSATFNTAEFAEYFKNYSREQFIEAPVFHVSKQSRYNTQIYYADQLSQIGTIPIYDEPKIEPSLYDLFVVLVKAFNKLDPINPGTNTKNVGNVLVFLPGILEIEEAHDKLVAYSEKQKDLLEKEPNIEWHILPLHSSITTEEQKKVFLPPPPGKRKIILSTNIAESSITVPDIFYVIDFCLTKILIADSDTQYQSLQLQWASHVNCMQRSGRVGRVADGRVYRLITRRFYEYNLSENVQPEMLRAPLNQVVLKAKQLEFNQPPKAILALAMNPPDLSKIDNTVLFLKEIGGLSMNCNGQKTINDGDLTFLGKVMANLPLDVHLSKFIVLGHMFSCVEDCVIMACGCSLNIFKTPFKERLKAYINRLQWADGSASDLIALRNIYKVWQRHRRMNRDAKAEIAWCKRNYVSQRSLREWAVLVNEVQTRLATMQIRKSEGPTAVVLSHTELPTIIRVVICGAFYPYYFIRSCDGGQIDEREAVKVLGGRDPFNTVYFTNFDSNQPGLLYVKTIKSQLKDCGMHLDVNFDCSSKVYVQFTNPNQTESVTVDGQEFITGMPGKIKVNVYRAIRLRQLRLPVRIPVLSKVKAWELAKTRGITDTKEPLIMAKMEVDDTTSEITQSPVLPGLEVQFIQIAICERIDCGHFWAHHVDEQTKSNLQILEKLLNSSNRKLEKIDPKKVEIDGLYAAMYQVDKQFYRCKVISKHFVRNTQVAQIIFIDYGNTGSVNIDELFLLPPNEFTLKPAQAMECVLSEIQPSAISNPSALWSNEANKAFAYHTRNNIFYGKIYSVVQGVVHLELFSRSNENKFERSLNHWLISQGYAQLAEESFLSKENNQRRLQLHVNPEMVGAYEKAETEYKHTQDVDPPDDESCRSEIVLRGPFSPLEMQIFAVVASGATQKVNIEGNSVNSVLLDTDPQDPHERLVVAAHIGQNTAGTHLSLRNTTVMPNIHGFPMLMALLFCPTVETKPTADGSRFGAILCGLGSMDNNNRSIYPPHDICLTLDTDLRMQDLDNINSLRYWMNVFMKTMNSDEYPDGKQIEICQREVKKRLFEILKAERSSVERVFVKHANVWGKCLYYSEMLTPGESFISEEIWPLHSTLQLNRSALQQTVVKEEINNLEEFVLGMKPRNEVHCKFCNVTAYSTAEMRVHMTSEQHIKAVQAAQQTAQAMALPTF